MLPKSFPIPANNHTTITMTVHDANSATQFLDETPVTVRFYQGPPKAASVVRSRAAQSVSRSSPRTSSMARTVSGTM